MSWNVRHVPERSIGISRLHVGGRMKLICWAALRHGEPLNQMSTPQTMSSRMLLQGSSTIRENRKHGQSKQLPLYKDCGERMQPTMVMRGCCQEPSTPTAILTISSQPEEKMTEAFEQGKADDHEFLWPVLHFGTTNHQFSLHSTQ